MIFPHRFHNETIVFLKMKTLTSLLTYNIITTGNPISYLGQTGADTLSR